MFLHDIANYTMYFAKSYAPVQESRYRNFICRIEHCRHCATLAQRMIRQCQCGEALLFNRKKVQQFSLRKVEPLPATFEPMRKCQRVGDGNAHVGDAELGNDRTILVTHHPVPQPLRTNDAVDT